MNLRLRNPALTASVVITLVFWASAFTAIRIALSAYSAQHLALARYIIASIVLLLIALAKGIRRPEPSDWPAIFTTGFFGVVVYHVSLNRGEMTVPAATASFLINSTPVFTAILAATLLKERLPLRGWAGIAISFAGVGLISLGESHLEFNQGVLWILLSAFATSLYSVVQKPYLPKYGALAFTCYGVWAGTLVLCMFAQGLWDTVQQASWKINLIVLYLGALPAALGGILWAYILSKMEASRAATILYLIPTLAILIAWLAMDELPSLLSVLGGLISLAGVVMVNRNK